MAYERRGARKREGSREREQDDRLMGKNTKNKLGSEPPFLSQTGTRQALLVNELTKKALWLYDSLMQGNVTFDLNLPGPQPEAGGSFLVSLPSSVVLSIGFGALPSHLHPDKVMIVFQESSKLCLPIAWV